MQRHRPWYIRRSMWVIRTGAYKGIVVSIACCVTHVTRNDYNSNSGIPEENRTGCTSGIDRAANTNNYLRQDNAICRTAVNDTVQTTAAMKYYIAITLFVPVQYQLYCKASQAKTGWHSISGADIDKTVQQVMTASQNVDWAWLY